MTSIAAPLAASASLTIEKIVKVREDCKDDLARALQALDQLGPTAQDVAQSLRSRNIQGGHMSVDCPLYRYLKSVGHHYRIGAMHLYLESSDAAGLSFVEVAHIPDACRAFISAYDTRQAGFRDLEEGYNG